ncbi:hypothetical protein Agub_g8845 [Astrephomene gubernaculifera]|uniref:Ribonuclease H2 subunit B wHTH domain-containing protein n=1 Tax=Astrephomene gubernaculifera TaxID=47775 RepID=A0AAD3DU62_9CHLO|nr:hypothetical protein Agub_g8845 [Astrephomene gubernaculifera]
MAASEDESWRVLVVPGLKAGELSTIRSFMLPDPRTGRSQGFLLSGGRLLEVNRFKQAHSAWLTPERLIADGGMFLATPFDPLFMLLPLLDRARDKDDSCPAGKFKELEELLYDSSMPGLGELLPYARSACTPVAAAAAGQQAAAAMPKQATAPAAAEAEPAAAPLTTSNDRQPAGEETAASEGQQGQQQQQEQEPPSSATAEQGAAAKAAEGPPGGEQAAASGPAAAASEQQQAACLQQRQQDPAAAVAVQTACVSLEQQLACICDVRKVEDTCYYRLNDDRVLAWLRCKFRQLQAALAAQLAGMDAAHAKLYVLGFLGEYVGDPWVSRLAKSLGANEKEASGTPLQPADGNALPASRPAPTPLAGPPEKKQKIDPRVAAKQASLAKQAVGTKKLTSFFTKK